MMSVVDQNLIHLFDTYMKKKRQDLPLFSHDPRKGVSTFARKGVPRPHITIVLRTPGCSWLRKTGGCTMCGFAIDSLYPTPTVNPQDIMNQFQEEMRKYSYLSDPLTVSIFNNGSFFNPEEIPPPADMEILTQLSKDRRVQEVRIETRPEFVTSSFLENISSLFEDTELHIAIGLEVCSDKIRSLSIHKGFSYHDFVRAAEKIKNWAHLDVYLLLKPPFLTEGEAVTEIKKSLDILASDFPSTVYITPCKVFPTTLLKDLQERGLYRIPWLWSLLDIAQFFAECSYPFRLFLVSGEPVEEEPCQGVLGAKNCGTCDQKIRDLIDAFNRTQNLVEPHPVCECRKDWEEVLVESAAPLRERVLNFLREVIQ